MEVTISDLMLTEKPQEKMIQKVNNSLCKKDLSIEELASAIGKGCSFCPGVFTNDKRNKENFISASFITLDIDDSPIPLEEVRQVFSCTISYPTFSNDVQNNKYRYRLIIRLDEDLKSLDEYYMYAEILSNLLKEETGVCVDTTCYQGERMFFGTNHEVNTTISDYDYEKKYLYLWKTTHLNYISTRPINSIQLSKDIKYSFTTFDTCKPIYNYLMEGKSDYDILCKGQELGYKFIVSSKDMIDWNEGEEIRIEPEHIEIKRHWRIDDSGKRNPRKWGVGEDRRKRFLKVLSIKKQIKPDITYDELLYNAICERSYFFYNYDDKLNNKWILSILPSVLRHSYHFETTYRFTCNTTLLNANGKSYQKAVAEKKHKLLVDAIIPLYNPSFTIQQNLDAMQLRGIQISLSTLKRILKENRIIKYRKRGTDTSSLKE